MKIRFMLVEDFRLVREGLKLLLENIDGYEVIGEAANGLMALSLLDNGLEPDIIFMDINMDKMDGIQATSQIMAKYPGSRIIALTMLKERKHIEKMLEAGATGYVLKSASEQEIQIAVERAMNGERFYSTEVLDTLMQQYHDRNNLEGTENMLITPREKEVLRLIIEENSNKEIAEALFISTRTVESHKRNLIEKTGSKNIAGLVYWAIKSHVFDDI